MRKEHRAMQAITMTRVFGLTLFLVFFVSALCAKDLRGSKDHPTLIRYEGSEIILTHNGGEK